ncbi:MAG: hypothetical protein KC776_23105, partial [Myxococcales bacterium]|nr:hypothetical protein [Myxococcales bacterium]
EESQNAAFYSNPKLDRILTEARRSSDRARRMQLYREAEAIVADDAPWATAYSYRYFELWQPYVHGYRPHPVLSQYVRNMWFDREQQKTARGNAPCWNGVPGLDRRCKHAPRTTLALALGRLP